MWKKKEKRKWKGYEIQFCIEQLLLLAAIIYTIFSPAEEEKKETLKLINRTFQSQKENKEEYEKQYQELEEEYDSLENGTLGISIREIDERLLGGDAVLEERAEEESVLDTVSDCVAEKETEDTKSSREERK